MKYKNYNVCFIILVSFFFLGLSSVNATYLSSIKSFNYGSYTIPAYDGDSCEAINNNSPKFTSTDRNKPIIESYSNLDSLKRCGIAFANINQSLMPTGSRGSISSVTPSGWVQAKYDNVPGKYLYNRSHLIGWQLTGENANSKNMMMDINNNLKYRTQKENNLSRFEKPFEGPTPASRQRSVDFQYRKKGNDMEPFYRYKNVEYYGQRDPDTFGYDQIDDKYRYYSPFRNDYDGSRYGSYIYNYYLNAPMRGDISEDFKYPPQYYYKPKCTYIKPPKVFTNLI